MPLPIVQHLVVKTRLDGDGARPRLNLHFIGEAATADVERGKFIINSTKRKDNRVGEPGTGNTPGVGNGLPDDSLSIIGEAVAGPGPHRKVTHGMAPGGNGKQQITLDPSQDVWVGPPVWSANPADEQRINHLMDV